MDPIGILTSNGDGDGQKSVFVRGGKLDSLSNKRTLLIVIVVLALTGLRFVNLGADFPSKWPMTYKDQTHLSVLHAGGDGLIDSVGLHVDEGYKTLSPRNMILFGSAHWNPNDDYHGWIKISPFTQWAYYGAFNIFGVNIKSARFVTIVCFFILLSVYAYTMSQNYSNGLFFSGLIILGLQNLLFFFSRIALFEVPLILFIYCLLLVLKKEVVHESTKAIILVLGVTCFVTFFIKLSALIYLFPVFVGFVSSLIIRKCIFKKRLSRWKITILTICFLIVLFQLTHNTWLSRIQFSAPEIMRRLLFYPPILKAPVIVLCGLICSLHGLFYRPKDYLSNVYRASLVSIVFLSPLALAFFKYNPARYYVPILPAYILISLEWVSLKSWNDPFPEKRMSIVSSLGLIVILWLVCFYFLFALNVHFLKHIPFDLGDDPGVSVYFMFRCFTLISVFLSILAYVFKKVVFSKEMTCSVLSVLLVLGIFYNVFQVGYFLINPSYQSEKIGVEMSSILPPTATIAGDWAPLFALNTKIRALYMNDEFNTASRLEVLRPDYFVYSDTFSSDYNMKIIKELKGVALGLPVYQSRYIGRDVVVYPIKFEG